MAMSVYDPFGFVSVVTVFSKILLRKIWRTGIMWDANISEDLISNWNDWQDGVDNVCLSILITSETKVALPKKSIYSKT